MAIFWSTKQASATLEHWVDQRQSGGKYVFLRREAVEESGLSAEAVKKALQRLASRGRIAKAKDYFFVVVPLEYAAAGSPPASWFIHDLMTAMERRYYVGLLTAAGLHGASPSEYHRMAASGSLGRRRAARTRFGALARCRRMVHGARTGRKGRAAGRYGFA